MDKQASDKEIAEFLEKVKSLEKAERMDLSSDEDLSIAIMNLISMEEHFFFTYNKTGDEKYLNLLNDAREIRKSALKRIIKDYEGEVWCISKHLLAASMRFMEVGTKYLTKNDRTSAKEMFKYSYQLYSLFWGLNLGLISTEGLSTKTASNKQNINYLDEQSKPQVKNTTSIFSKLGDIVQKAIDCCKE